MKQLLRLYEESLAETKSRFSAAELKMLLDLSNSTYLSTMLMGEQIIPNLEDAFALDPGMYEEKWGVNSEPMLAKLRDLTPFARACLEIWANECWYGNDSAADVDIETYLKGPNLTAEMQQALAHLAQAIDLMQQTREAFKSKTVAQARAEAEKAKSILEGL